MVKVLLLIQQVSPVGADSGHCLQMLMDWMYKTKQREHLNAHG